MTDSPSHPVRVLVLVDALHPREAVAAVLRLMHGETVELLLVYVESPASRAGLEMMGHRPGGGHPTWRRELEMTDAERARAASALADAETLAREGGGSVDTLVASGEAGRIVCELAEQRQVDLVVVRSGAKDRPHVGPRSLGPAARFITDHSPCPVLLVR